MLAFNREKLNLRHGLYGSILVAVILLLAAAFGRPGITGAIGALIILSADLTGKPADRLYTLGGLTLAGALLTALIFAIGTAQPLVAVSIIMLSTFFCSIVLFEAPHLARAMILMNLWFVIADSLARTPGDIVWPGIGFFIGGICASGLGIVNERRATSKKQPTTSATRPETDWQTMGQQALNPHSLTFQFALIRAIALGISTSIGWLLFNVNPFWPAIATLVIVQPDYHQALLKGAQRVSGTVLGVLLGIGFVTLIARITLLEIVLVIIIFGYFVLRKTNYLLSTTLVTIAVILIYRIGLSADALVVGAQRIGATIFGIIVAIITTTILSRMLTASTTQIAPQGE